MNSNFDKIKHSIKPFQKRVPKPWGHEIIFTPENAPAAGKILFVNAGKRLSLQYHDQKIETLCLISGEAKITLSDKNGTVKEITMETEKGYFIQPGQVHRVRAVTNVVFIESSIPEIGNTIRLEDDINRGTETEEMRKLDNLGWNGKTL